MAVTILTLVTFIIGWNPTLSINVVVLVHLFLKNLPFTSGLIINEIVRVLIGLSVALMINWRMPTKENEFKKDMIYIEQLMHRILNSIADMLRGKTSVQSYNADNTLPKTKSDAESNTCIEKDMIDLESHLKSGMNSAYAFANNDLSSHARYYMNYISLRE